MVLAMALFAGRDTMNKLLGSSMAISQILLFVGFFGSVVLIVFVPQPFSAVANNIIANTKANFFEVK